MNEKIEEKENIKDNYVFIDLNALFYYNIHWFIFKKILKEDFFYAMKLCFIYLSCGHYRFSELLAPYLELYNLDELVNQNVLEFLKLKEGHVYFCTEMCTEICDKIFNDYKLVFDGYLSSSNQFNLSGSDKLIAIQNLVEDNHLTYIGCSKKDLVIFEKAHQVGVVLFYNYSESLLKKVRALNSDCFVFYVEKK